ncbi:MAG: lipo-like protein [Rhodobiaceae bacterium]|nr:lipo-like protein [Rhodobiaceae bacterium]MCC0012707.1 lipo-like protein [Rhodobiaceae bacterium]MCC0017986.1 lipo-like protein [Rhodobiaceae bacterium]MCC0052226.1 lipo-like protein [Rhodobiaceae bacterium]MCC0062062.1 lipo-like protein [Rhodobiaceae bacterium]
MGYTLLEQTGRYLARLLTKPSPGYEPFAPIPTDRLLGVLEPGDIILVEGHQYLSSAIKYLTMSTWSHAAMYVGEIDGAEEADGEPHRLIEVLIGPGCITAPLSKYDCHNIRICRPVGLTPEDRDMVVTYMRERIGLKYDLKNVFDLLRYLFPTPPIPVRFRRRMIALGSGDPTRAICSTLIAQAFQHVRYPILPKIETVEQPKKGDRSNYTRQEILHIRHHSLFAPRDFDLSPYFAVIKPTIHFGFDYKGLVWHEGDSAEESNLES